MLDCRAVWMEVRALSPEMILGSIFAFTSLLITSGVSGFSKF